MGLYGATIDITTPLFRRLRDDQTILAQSILMRLSTAPGTYWTHPEYGYPLAELVNEGMTPERAARIPYEIKDQIEQDTDRIESASVTIASAEQTPAGVRVAFVIDVTPRATGPFELVLGILDLTVEILTQRSV